MHVDRLIKRMDCFGQLIRAFKEAIPAEDAHWKPSAKDWSIVEILSHMVDIETDDMRTRLRLTLEDPTQERPPIDPEGWTLSRNYAANNFEEVLERFLCKRAASVSWLRALDSPDWSSTHDHPKFASLRAGDILAAWCADDALHLRQISKRLYQLTKRDAGLFQPDYAGEWKA